MNRISSIVRAAAFAATLAATPSLAATPAEEFVAHFSAQPVSAEVAGVSIGNPVEDYKAALKGEIAGYEAGHTAYASADNPRQDFINQLSVNAVNVHVARESLAEAK